MEWKHQKINSSFRLPGVFSNEVALKVRNAPKWVKEALIHENNKLKVFPLVSEWCTLKEWICLASQVASPHKSTSMSLL